MEISRVRALRGPNLWGKSTAIEAVVRCTPEEDAVDRVDGFERRLRARFAQIGELRATGSTERVPMARVLQLAALGLQAQAGCPVTFGRTSPTGTPGEYQIVFEYTEEKVGRLALEHAQHLCHAAEIDNGFDLPTVLAQLRELDEDLRLGPSTGSIVDAAVARGIPYRRLTEGSIVQFGWGSRQRRIQAAEIDATSAIAESIAQDKQLTKDLLHACGVPVPIGRPVDSIEDAWAAMQEIAGPVVVKPQDGNQGKGVSVNIETREQLQTAYASAREISRLVMVERFIPGHDFRLLVVGRQLVAAARRDPPQVIGDGVSTVRQLVDAVNADPRRGDGHATPLTRIRFDDMALTRLRIQGYTADSVPPKGARVRLRNNANLSTGGTATDVTDTVHPELAARAVEAALAVGLDVAGIDVVCETVVRPLEQQGGGVVEVNAAPGLRMHLQPSFGKGRPVGEAIINELYADGDNGRIPVVAVTGTNGKTTTVRLIAHMLGRAGHCVGMTNTDGIYVGDQRIDTGDCSGPRSARNVLMHPEVDAAVFETARGGLLREGLGFDRCDVAVVTNLGAGDHLGMNFITTVEDLAVLKRVVVQNVSPNGTSVLNACDPVAAAMAEHCPGSVTFFGADASHPRLVTHRAQGKRVIFADGDALVAACGDQEHRIPYGAIPFTRGGTIGFQLENAMASVGAAWALGLRWDVIEAGLRTFATDSSGAPGRFNVMEYNGATVIADYGHNPDAIAALVRAVDAMPATRRSVVISAAGDRRDEDVRQQTRILGQAFDEVLLYEDQCQRGRADGEVIALLRQGLEGAQRPSRIDEVRGEFRAIDLALSRLRPGELCLVLVDQVEEALAHLRGRIAQGAD